MNKQEPAASLISRLEHAMNSDAESASYQEHAILQALIWLVQRQQAADERRDDVHATR